MKLSREFVYLSVIMDVFTRSIRGWNPGRGLDQELTLTALQWAMACRRPDFHHSDQGVQYACTACVQMLLEAGVQISMAEVGQAWQNGYAERLIRTIKEEEIDLVRRLPGRLPADSSVPGGGVHAQADTLIAGVSDACGVREPVAGPASFWRSPGKADFVSKLCAPVQQIALKFLTYSQSALLNPSMTFVHSGDCTQGCEGRTKTDSWPQYPDNEHVHYLSLFGY